MLTTNSESKVLPLIIFVVRDLKSANYFFSELKKSHDVNEYLKVVRLLIFKPHYVFLPSITLWKPGWWLSCIYFIKNKRVLLFKSVVSNTCLTLLGSHTEMKPVSCCYSIQYMMVISHLTTILDLFLNCFSYILTPGRKEARFRN